MRKMSVAVAISVICILCFRGVNTAAYSMEDSIAEILNTIEGQEAVITTIEEYYSCGSYKDSIHKGLNGEVKISKPVAVPLYNVPSESLIDISSNEMYSVCYIDDKAIGLLRYVQYDELCMDFYILPDDFSHRTFSLFTYDWILDKQGNTLYGGNPANVVFVADNMGTELVYLGKQDFKSIYDTDIKTVVKEEYPKVRFSDIAGYNLIDENIPIMLSVSLNMPDIPEAFSCIIVNAQTNKALTYDNGKYTLEEMSPEIKEKQLHNIVQRGNGFSISPQNDSNKSIKAAGSKIFDLSFSYFGKSVCRISGADGNVLKNKNDKLVYGDYDNLDLGCEWVLILC